MCGARSPSASFSSSVATGKPAQGSAIMSRSIPRKPLLQSLRVGVAVVEPDGWEILFENGRFFGWFRPTGAAVERLPSRVRGLDLSLARRDQRRPYGIETDVRDGARTFSPQVELRPETFDEQSLIVVEVPDISKRKEAEYMLDSYSKMAEKHARDLQK